MILINNNWHDIKELHDAIRVIKEEFSYELAKVIESLLPTHSDDDYYDVIDTMNDMQNEMEAMEDELCVMENENEELKYTIADLEDRIAELENE